MIAKRAEFIISRCDPEKRTDCKSDEEIDEYVKDIAIDIWSTFEKYDAKKYHEYPVEQILDYHKSNMMI